MDKAIIRQFQEYFSNEFCLAAAPGRVNLIGEHTDYNQGFVLPGAINRNIYVGMMLTRSAHLELYAPEFKERYSFPLDNMQPVKGWPTYVLGMIHGMMPEKKLNSGLKIMISGNVPVGAGMSSSAALCAATGLVLNEIFQLGFSRLQIALAAQQTEHQFAGVKTGIMDQFASLFGKSGHVIKLDCRSMEYAYLPFEFPDLQILLVNTLVSHTLAASEYNLRRQQCEEGVEILKRYDPSIQSLRDVPYSLLNDHQKEFDPVIYRRCRFILEENQRLLTGCEFLEKKDAAGFGRLMFESHKGLSRDYEVSCTESDFLVELMKKLNGIKGARQMGGGFGGCIICLAENSETDLIRKKIGEKYQQQFSKIPEFYSMNIEEGARIIPQ